MSFTRVIHERTRLDRGETRRSLPAAITLTDHCHACALLSRPVADPFPLSPLPPPYNHRAPYRKKSVCATLRTKCVMTRTLRWRDTRSTMTVLRHPACRRSHMGEDGRGETRGETRGRRQILLRLVLLRVAPAHCDRSLLRVSIALGLPPTVPFTYLHPQRGVYFVALFEYQLV